MKQLEIEQQSNNSMNDMRRNGSWNISMSTNTAIHPLKTKEVVKICHSQPVFQRPVNPSEIQSPRLSLEIPSPAHRSHQPPSQSKLAEITKISSHFYKHPPCLPCAMPFHGVPTENVPSPIPVHVAAFSKSTKIMSSAHKTTNANKPLSNVSRKKLWSGTPMSSILA
jgi:hypothetical protein